MKNTKTKKKEVKLEDTTELIDEEKPVKKIEKVKKEKKEEIEEPFIDNSYHYLQKLMFIVLIILVIGAIGFYYYNNIYSSPKITFIKSLTKYQDKIKYEEAYNKLNAVLDFNLKTDNETKKAGYNVLSNLSINLTFTNDKEMSYMEVNTKSKDGLINLKAYGNRENDKYITYLKLDKGYDKYLKYETKYLQYFSLIKLVKEEKLSKNIEKILTDTLKKGNFKRETIEEDGKKITSNTLTINNVEYKELMTKIINAIKNNKDFMKKLSKHYNKPEELLNNYLKKVNDSKNSYEITTYNKRNLNQDLIRIEIINNNTNCKITLTPKNNTLSIKFEKCGKDIDITIDRNSNSSYKIVLGIKKDTDDIKVETVINLDKTTDVTELKINDEMLITELNKDTLDSIIPTVTNTNISNILKIFKK